MSLYGEGQLAGMPADPTLAATATSRYAEIRGGVLSGVYVLHYVAVLIAASAFFIFVFGTGGTLINPAEAYTTWNWWRIYGATFYVFLLPSVVYFLYQERKVAMTGGQGRVATYSRAQIQIIFAIYMVMVVVLGLWTGLLTVWVGVADFNDCANSPICSGPSMSGTPCTGAIMIIVGLGVMTLMTIVFVIGGIYVHAAARDAFNARMSLYFPMSDQIGGRIAAPVSSGIIEYVDGEPVTVRRNGGY